MPGRSAAQATHWLDAHEWTTSSGGRPVRGWRRRSGTSLSALVVARSPRSRAPDEGPFDAAERLSLSSNALGVDVAREALMEYRTLAKLDSLGLGEQTSRSASVTPVLLLASR